MLKKKKKETDMNKTITAFVSKNHCYLWQENKAKKSQLPESSANNNKVKNCPKLKAVIIYNT